MPKITVNTENALFMGTMTPDTYDAICTGVELREKRSAQGEYTLMWSFDIDYEGKLARLSRFTPISGPGAGFTTQMLAGLEIDYEEVDDNLSFDGDDAVDIACFVTVNTREDENGQPRNEVQAVSRRNPQTPSADAGEGTNADAA